MRTVLTAGMLAAFAAFAAAPNPVAPDPATPRPIAVRESVFTEDMTWMEIRDAMKAGKDTILIATGGLEQNGPYLVTNKHNIVLRGMTEAIARKLGDTLVAPIIPFVPEGNFDPPTEHMKYAGSVGLTEETYRRLLVDIVTSFQVTGFKHIVLIGDSGGNQKGMKAVAEQLNDKWKDKGVKVSFIPEYYNYGDVAKFLESNGIKQENEGLHDDFGMTAVMLSIDPNSVRMKERQAAGKFRINGVDLDPVEKTREWGKRIIEFRAKVAVNAIQKARGK
ncbi:MAG: creatininase family protein [Planctomycetaceae bacterium]|nr:creatininase family protein [Planctomycetaceae bacterium]